jgi:hypothetical protein
MVITILSKLNDDVQAWTFDIRESDLMVLMQKYGHTGEGVLLDADELPIDLQPYYE